MVMHSRRLTNLVSVHTVAIFESEYFSQGDPDGESHHSQSHGVRDQVGDETEIRNSRRPESEEKKRLIESRQVSVRCEDSGTWTHPVGISPTTSTW